MGNQCQHPVTGKGAGGGIVDIAQGLEGKAGADAEIKRNATHHQGSGTGRTTLVEDEDLGLLIAPELQGKHGQQHRLARTCGTDNHGVTDITHMQIEPERRGPPRCRIEQWRLIEMIIPMRASPDT